MTTDNKQKLLLYSIAHTFNTVLGIEICEETKTFLIRKEKRFNKLTNDNKIYYMKYALQLVSKLTEKDISGEITKFELNVELKSDIDHHFRLIAGKEITHISMSHAQINVKDIIPKKLMKICKYKKNTNISKAYNESYKSISTTIYNKIQSKIKYSNISEKTKDSVIYIPMTDLFHNTLSKKRKCAPYLFKHLFNESDRIVLKLYKNRFCIYDFRKQLEYDPVESYKMKIDHPNKIMIIFNNDLKFTLTLLVNGSEIKEHLSLKFNTQFNDLEKFNIFSSSVHI